jgi:hypothetical protein
MTNGPSRVGYLSRKDITHVLALGPSAASARRQGVSRAA